MTNHFIYHEVHHLIDSKYTYMYQFWLHTNSKAQVYTLDKFNFVNIFFKIALFSFL